MRTRVAATLAAVMLSAAACIGSHHRSPGVISGTFEAIGGPSPSTPKEPLSGEVLAHRGAPSGAVIARGVSTDGEFRLSLPAGTYYLTGQSTDGYGPCTTVAPVIVAVGASVHADVICPRS